MISVKKLSILATVACVLSFSGMKAYADAVGFVDLDKVISNYSKADDVSADLKGKEAELQKFLADAQKQLKTTATPVERKNLEDKLTKEFKAKSDSFKDSQIKEWKEVEDNVYKAIDTTAKTQKLDVVLNKAAVLSGGKDITDEVVTLLNKK